jgi:hypothetical protein
MPPPELIAILALVAIGWLWYDSLRAREAAVRAARRACDAEGLMLLDDTVAIAALKPLRDENGHVKLQRAYSFEYSDTGDNRLKGGVVLLGDNVVLLSLGRQGGAAIHHGDRNDRSPNLPSAGTAAGGRFESSTDD